MTTFLALLSCFLSLARSGAFFNPKQKGGRADEMPAEVPVGQASPQSNASRQGRHGRMDRTHGGEVESFCKKVIAHERCDCLRWKLRYVENEANFSDLPAAYLVGRGYQSS